MRRFAPLAVLVLTVLCVAPARAATATITLEDPGQEPRRTLRYAFDESRDEGMSMTMDMKQRIELAQRPPFAYNSPRTVIVMDLGVSEPGDEGNYGVEWEITEARVVEREGDVQQAVAAMRQALGATVGVKGSYTLTPSGQSRESDLVVPDGVPAEIVESMGSMNDNIENLALPLPTEEVGVGAVWVVETEQDVQGLAMQQTLRATLRSIVGDRISYDVELTQTAEPGQVMDSVPGQYVNTLDSLEGNGKGSVIVDLGRLVPVESKMQTSNSLVIETQLLTTNESAKQTVDTSIEVLIQPAQGDEE